MFDKSQVLKILGLCILVIILAKALAPFFGETIWQMIFGSKKKRNSDIDFDALISQKKSMLRAGQTGVEGATGTQKKKSKGQSEEVIQKTYTELSSKQNRNEEENKKFEDLKATIKVLDSLQWGNIPEIEALMKKLSQSYSYRFNSTSASVDFKNLLQRDAFLGPKNDWQGLKKAFEIVESFTLLKETTQSATFRDQLAKKWQMQRLAIEKALSLKFNSKGGNLSQLVGAKAVALPQIKEEKLLSFLTLSPGILKNKNTLLNEIKTQAELFHALSPLAPLKDNKDKAGAYKSLGLPPNASVDQIKSRYKKLAQLKHPDTLKAKGIPPEFESVATENFTQIKRAYDILIKG